MEINKYLKELGLTWYDLPGNYISKTSFKVRLKRRLYKIKRGFCFMFSALEANAPEWDNNFESNAFDVRNKINKDGFCSMEFFSLDYTFALFIYPRLCYFRDNYATIATPGCFCYDENGNHIDNADESTKSWINVLNKMILAFKHIITGPRSTAYTSSNNMEIIEKQIEEGLQLFIKYYGCLWY